MSDRTREAFQVRSLVILWSWTGQSLVSFVPAQTRRSMGSYCQENDAEVGRSFTPNVLNFGKQTILVQSTNSNTENPHTTLARNQLCNYADSVCLV